MDCPAVYFSFVHSDSRRVSVPNPLSRASGFGKLTSWKLQLGSLLLTHTFKIPQNGGQKAGSDFKGTQSSKYVQYIFRSARTSCTTPLGSSWFVRPFVPQKNLDHLYTGIYEKTHQTNPLAPWDPLSALLTRWDPLGPPGNPPINPLRPINRSLGLMALLRLPQLPHKSHSPSSLSPLSPRHPRHPPLS